MVDVAVSWKMEASDMVCAGDWALGRDSLGVAGYGAAVEGVWLCMIVRAVDLAYYLLL
jgi:hypothetical protein